MKHPPDNVVRELASIAMRACVARLRQHNIDPTATADLAVVFVRRHVKDAVPDALADAAMAHQAGMNQVAVATMQASMRLAGIRAADAIKERLT